MNALRDDSRREDQAALWAAKLDGGSLSGTDRADLDAWLARDPQNRTLLTQYCQFSADLEEQLPLLVAAGAAVISAEDARPRRHRHRRWWIASTLAAAAAIVIAVYQFQPAAVRNVATSVAERQTVKLQDGSVVDLNARTSLAVDFSGRERHVRMAEGEAFFTVAKDKSQPFIIETPAGAVRVTGTVFDVHAESPENLTVTVVEGSVQVNPTGAAAWSLKPNEQLTVASTRISCHHLDATQLENELAWRHGEAVFDGTSLREALAQFAYYHGCSIITAPSVASLRVSGRYRLDDLDGFLADITSVMPVRTSREASGAVVVTPRTGS
ncbi:MAG TPA: FecR domain-containing protein [Opitutaceae bacterium]|nr:FecR domain-containing protein [Opitutaceae bacterium]